MLTEKEKRELLQKHQDAEFRNRMHLVILGSALAGVGAIGMTISPDKAVACAIVLTLGLCVTVLGGTE